MANSNFQLLKIFLFQFSLVQKRENAHSEGIWACAWGEYIPGAQPSPKQNDTENQENERPPEENVPDEYELLKLDLWPFIGTCFTIFANSLLAYFSSVFWLFSLLKITILEGSAKNM